MPDLPDEILLCSECDCSLEDGEEFTHESESFCEDCFNERFTTYNDCGCVVPVDESFETPNSNWVCDSCYDESYLTCDLCNCVSYRDTSRYVDSGGITICEDCYCDHYVTCPECGDVVDAEYAMYSESHDCYMCEECYHDDDDNDIESWNFKPRFRIFGKRGKHTPTYGTEVEVSTEGRDRKDAAMLFKGSDLFYLTEDGSINYGFEIVSHPFTMEWIKENIEVLNPLFNLRGKARGFAAKDCGMHIHVGRQAFLGSAHLYKFVKIFMDNYDFTLKVSRRSATRLSQWADVDSWEMAGNCKKKQSGQRYRSVNLQNRNTVEVRIFQSTISKQGYFANLECVDGVVNFTRDCSMKDCTIDNFIHYMNDRVKEYPNFKSLFKY